MRRRFREGGSFEEAAAYSRAARVGGHIAVSGTAARTTDGDAYVCCPDPDERVVMRIERTGERVLRTEDLT